MDPMILFREGSLDDVVHAVSGEEGLEAIRTGEYDVVFKDVQLPGMDGVKVTRMVRSEPVGDGQTGCHS